MTATKTHLHSSERAPGFQRRQLKRRDLERMRLPYRFWESRYERIAEGKAKEVIETFMRGMGNVFDPGVSMHNGFGLIIWGDNDGGKTSAAAVIAKEARRRGFSALFVRATQYRDSLMSREMYDETNTLKQRCESVDLLIVDDLGKESSSEKAQGGSERMFEDLLRERSSNKRSTLITMNQNPHELEDRYEISMQKLFSEAFAIVRLFDTSQRDIEKQEMIKFFNKKE